MLPFLFVIVDFELSILQIFFFKMSDEEMETNVNPDEEQMEVESPDVEEEVEDAGGEDDDTYGETSTSSRSKRKKGKGKSKGKGGKRSKSEKSEFVDPQIQSSDEICDIYNFQNIDFDYTNEDYETIGSFKVCCLFNFLTMCFLGFQ